MSFIAALKAEIASLEEELLANKIYQRLGEARRLLALYADEQPAQSGRAALHQMYAERALKELTSRRGSPERLKALEAARLFLVNRTAEPTPTALIHQHISDLGIEIGGKDPQNNLSAMLSNSPIFLSHGRAGWTLMREEDLKDGGEDGDEDLTPRTAAPPPPPPPSPPNVPPPPQSSASYLIPSRRLLDDPK